MTSRSKFLAPWRRVVVRCAVFALALAACRAPDPGLPDAELAVGSWVEVQGRVVDGAPIVEEVETVERKPADAADKLEITAPARGAVEGETLHLAGADVEIHEKSEFVDERGDAIEPFTITAGDWLRVKARIRSTGALRAREIERVATERFEVEGELAAIDREAGTMRVGTLDIPLPQSARLQLPDEEVARGSDPLRLFLADERKSVPFTLRPLDDVALGGQVSLSATRDVDRDLNGARDRDETGYEVEAKIDALWTFDRAGSFALFEAKAVHDWAFREGRENEENARESVSRAYAYLKLSEALRLQVGRHDFDEEREWLYDEILDGGRLTARTGDFEFEVAAAAGRTFLAETDNSTQDTATYVALARWYVTDEHWLTGYGLARKDSSVDDFEPQLFGLRSFSRPSKGFGHWVELALADGRDGAKDIAGHAFDVGLLYRFDAPWRPTLAVGYAYGLGRDPGDTREGFRQSGLQDNNSKFGGVTSFKYYGEVFEPELANLDVTTLGFGVRPHIALSFDVVLHTFRQDYKSTELFPNKLRAQPNGRSADLGWEADLIVGYRHGRMLTAELVAGRFDPGAAFDGDDPAYKFEAQVRVKF